MKTGVEEEWCWRLDKAARSESGPPDWRVETVVSKSFPPTLSLIRSDEIPSSMFVIVDCSVSAILRRVESWLTKLVSGVFLENHPPIDSIICNTMGLFGMG
ncbi:hypothetical protein Hanom_Chr10g00897951 [Helianthus anomalus]